MADAYMKVKDNGANGLELVRESAEDARGALGVSALKNAVDSIGNEIYYFDENPPEFVVGSISTSNGKSGTLNTRVRCGYIELKSGDCIVNEDNENYRFVVYKYNQASTAEGSYIGYEQFYGTRYEVTDNKYYRIMGAKTTSDVFTEEEAASFGSIVYCGIKKSKIDEKADADDLAGKVPFPTADPHGEYGDLLSSNGNGSTTWVHPGQPSPEVIEAAVGAWLDEHPEATSGTITPLQFGAVANGVADDTQAIQDAIDYAVLNAFPVVDGAGKTYAVGADIDEYPSGMGSNRGLYIYGNLIFRNFRLKLLDEVSTGLTSVLNAYNAAGEKIRIEDVVIDGNIANQNSVPSGIGQDGGFHGIRVGFTTDCGSVEICRCDIRNCFTDGICTRPVIFDSLVIRDCIVAGNGRNGITDNAFSSYLENCKIIGNGVRHNPKSGYHIEPDSDADFGTKRLYNCVIKDNIGRDFKVYFNAHVYNVENLEIDSCEIGGISWGNHGTNGDCVHKNIKIKDSVIGLFIYGNGDTSAALNKFENMEIVNSRITGSISVRGGGSYDGEMFRMISSVLDGTADIENVDQVIVSGCRLNSGTYSLNFTDRVDGVILTGNAINSSGGSVPVDFGNCGKVICCENLSNKTETGTFDVSGVTTAIKANNIFGA